MALETITDLQSEVQSLKNNLQIFLSNLNQKLAQQNQLNQCRCRTQSLQTQQQLGVQALSLANQSDQTQESGAQDDAAGLSIQQQRLSSGVRINSAMSARSGCCCCCCCHNNLVDADIANENDQLQTTLNLRR